MTWSDKLQEFQAELYAKIIDYIKRTEITTTFVLMLKKMKSISWLVAIGFRSMLWTSLML